MKLRIDRIKDLISEAYNSFHVKRGLLSFFVEWLPVVGGFFKKRRLLKNLRSHKHCLDILREAFFLGYIPGGGEGKPEEWSNVSLESSLDLLYYPPNWAYAAELLQLAYSRADSDASVPAKIQPEGGYKVSLSVDAIMDLEGLSPPMKNKHRKLKWGNQNIVYWLAWADQLKGKIDRILAM